MEKKDTGCTWPDSTGLETPCIVLDMARVRRNGQTMQREADRAHCRLRPHIKTHKIPQLAQLQLSLGACGITCSKLGEAEIMSSEGIGDIFIAYPLVGRSKLTRAMGLNRRVPRLIFGVDSLATARMLQEAACADGQMVEVRMELDTGAGRTGVPAEQGMALARAIRQMPNLKMTGIYTFKGLTFEGNPTLDIQLAAHEEGILLQQMAGQLRSDGFPPLEISGGSTPTGVAVARTGAVTEIRPGTYLFNDYMQVREGHCTTDDIAVRIYATVVSTPRPGFAVIDGGSKTFPMDTPLDSLPCFFPGYAVVEGHPNLQLRRMNEEHGILTSRTGDTGLRVGDTVRLIPIHVCTAVNLQNHVYLSENGTLQKASVAARGALF